MAKGQAKKVPIKVQAKVQPKTKTEVQADNMIFSLDIGTRSIIGMVGVVVEDKVKIIAIEKEEHSERAMIDGQIENIEKVSALAKKVKKRLEDKVHAKLKRVSVAAAGRALRTSRVDYEMVLQGPQVIDDEVINRLEAGAISKAEAQFDAENEAQEDTRRFYLVGYTVCQYYLDQYMISSLKDHRGKHIKVDLIATFLPSEVVESLYTTMNKIGLEVASITLEPIAAINAAIPENLRLLNLVIVDIGAGTSDIAACTSGSVTGYTMATIAGDEITEAIMKEFLVDFMTAENMKAQIETEEEIIFTDILGFERKASKEELFCCIQGMSESLCREIAQKVLEVNGSAPSALFLAGGGSKLAGLREGLTAALKMDNNRVAIAGNNFRTNAFSDEYDLNNPEYATPLGIAISSGLNMINDSFRVTLNEKSAKLFRSGSFTVMNLLMMNGYGFQDMLGRSGASVSIRVNGKRKIFYGMAAQPASLFINKREGRLSDIVHAGDHIEFVPAVHGLAAKPCIKDIEGAAECLELTLNGRPADLETPLKNGDIIMMMLSDEQLAARKREAEEKAAEEAAAAAARAEQEEAAAAAEAEQEADIAAEAEQKENLAVQTEEKEDIAAGMEQKENLTVHSEQEENFVAETKQKENLAVHPEQGENFTAEPGQDEDFASESGQKEDFAVRAEQKDAVSAETGLEKDVLPEEIISEAAPLELEETEPDQGAESGFETDSAKDAGPEPEAEFAVEMGSNPESDSAVKEYQNPQAVPAPEEKHMQESESAQIQSNPEPESVMDKLQLSQAETPAEELQMHGAEPIPEELQRYGVKPITEELHRYGAEPITGELQTHEAEPLTEEMWNPKSGLSAERPSEAELTKKEARNAVEMLYEADEKSLVQSTLNLETETGRVPAADTVSEKRHHLQRSGLSVKERTSKLPSIKEALASKGFSAKKEPAALRGFSPVKEPDMPRETSRPRESAAPGNISRTVSAPSSGSGTVLFYLNDAPLRLPLKKDGASYYLMDMIEYSGIDLKQPKGRVTLSVNGEPGTFMQKLRERDIIRIVEEG
ncbi:cell division protein FtsA [Lachnospiraceae bacterium M18-1]|nr:cell division protein FtsA [Lachnospiraceae bacterium M18-1]